MENNLRLLVLLMSLKLVNIGLNLFLFLKIMLFDRDISIVGKFYFCKLYIYKYSVFDYNNFVWK